MKRIQVLLLLAILLLTYNVQAQKYSIGIKGGLAIPNLKAGGSNSPLSEGYSSRLGGTAGFYVERHFSPTFSLSAGLEYCSEGGKKDGFQALPSDEITKHFPTDLQPLAAQFPTYLYADYQNKAKLNYAMLPVLARFGWNFTKTSPLRFYMAVGPFAGLLIKATQETTKTGPLYFDQAGQQKAYDVLLGALMQQGISQEQAAGILNALPLNSLPSAKTDIDADTHNFNVGILGFIGFSYKFGSSSIFLEGGGNFGFLKIQKNAVDGQNRIGAGVVTLGYSYSF